MSHNNLANYYKTVFALAQHHHYQISEIENLMPFERDIYLELLQQYIKDLEKRQNNF